MATHGLVSSACRYVLALGLALLPFPGAARAQDDGGGTVIIMPQNRHAVIYHPHHPHRPAPVVKVTTVHTDVAIGDQVGTTTIAMTISNTGPGPQEAQVLVPVPDGASIRSFGLDSLGSEPTAKLLPRDEARRIYTQIVSSMKDPGLLEFVNCGLIRSSVFPIPAGGTQTVRLTYEHLLPADGDRIDYVLPRTDALEPSEVRWTVAVDVRSRRPISTVYSPSHEIVTERIDANHVVVRATAESAANPGSFRLSYLLEALGDGGVSATLVAYPDPELGPDAGYFLLLAGLPAQAPQKAEVKPREVTLVIDRSGSMRGQKMDQAREAALQVVEGLKPGEYFNIIDYSDSIASFAEKPVAKNDQTIQQVREYIKSLTANGGTNIHDALLEALRQAPTEGTLPVVLFLTDGLPTVGQTGEKDIRDAAKAANASGRRIFTFGVGFDVNAPLLTGIARGSRATSTFVLPEEDVEVKVGQVFRRLHGPVMDSPTIAALDGSGAVTTRAVREMQPSTLSDLFEGDQVILLGQYHGAEPLKLRLTGNFYGQSRQFDFGFETAKASARNSFVPRLWASRKIASLIEEIRLAGAGGAPQPGTEDPRTKELVQEVVRLSVKWGILTEYTAFLALEPGTNQVYGFAGSIIDSRGVARPGGAYDPSAGIVGEYRISGGAPSYDEVPAIALREVLDKAGRTREGAAAVSQDVNVVTQLGQAWENKLNCFIATDMQKVEIRSVCQVADQTLFWRGTRWVDARVLEKEAEAPDQTIEFASDAYFKLADELAAANQQGLLAQAGDIYLMHKGQRVLVKGATE